MIDPDFFIDACSFHGIDFFAGVPDSLLKGFCAALAGRSGDFSDIHHIIAANEGGAVALAAGHFLATGRPGLVYLQNSGEGNAVNPLLSLADPAVYGIPMVLLVGWRGEPGVPDEPQHAAQGQCTIPLLDALRVPNEILPPDEEAAEESLVRLVDRARAESRPVALVVRKGTFRQPHLRPPVVPDLSSLAREDALRALLRLLPPDARVVGSTGMISREIFELREHAGEPHDRDFLTVGSMGHASQIALGVHLARPDLPVVAVEGDGAALMHLGALAIVGRRADGHYLHVVLNNAAHDSVGGQPTVADSVDLPAVARACGYDVLPSASTLEGIAAALADSPFEGPRPSFLEIRVRKGARKDLGRPTVAPAASKTAFMAALRAER